MTSSDLLLVTSPRVMLPSHPTPVPGSLLIDRARGVILAVKEGQVVRPSQDAGEGGNEGKEGSEGESEEWKMEGHDLGNVKEWIEVREGVVLPGLVE